MTVSRNTLLRKSLSGVAIVAAALALSACAATQRPGHSAGQPQQPATTAPAPDQQGQNQNQNQNQTQAENQTQSQNRGY